VNLRLSRDLSGRSIAAALHDIKILEQQLIDHPVMSDKPGIVSVMRFWRGLVEMLSRISHAFPTRM